MLKKATPVEPDEHWRAPSGEPVEPVPRRGRMTRTPIAEPGIVDAIRGLDPGQKSGWDRRGPAGFEYMGHGGDRGSRGLCQPVRNRREPVFEAEDRRAFGDEIRLGAQMVVECMGMPGDHRGNSLVLPNHVAKRLRFAHGQGAQFGPHHPRHVLDPRFLAPLDPLLAR